MNRRAVFITSAAVSILLIIVFAVVLSRQRYRRRQVFHRPPAAQPVKPPLSVPSIEEWTEHFAKLEEADQWSELSDLLDEIAKHDPDAPHERLLVVDATTGSNALSQAREFHAAVDLTGLIVTKLDGSGKGGIVIAIQHELGIPTCFIGTGEKLEDLAPFDSRAFIEQML